jgi:leader peptidase (prepilin peptidase)/N-methyltransferase
MTIPAMITAVLFALLLPWAWGTDSHFAALAWCLLSGIIPSGILALFTVVCRLIIKRTVIGWGDVKLLLAIGMFIGLPGGIFALLSGAFIGAVFGLVSRKYNDIIPFAPFLAAGTLIWIFFSKYLLDAYYKFCILL